MKRKRTWLIIVGLVFAGLIIWLLWRLFNQPSVGTVSSPVGKEQTTQGEQWSQLVGKHFQVEYRSNYSSRPTGVPGEDHYFFVTNAAVSKHLAIAVDSLNGHGLGDEPSYKSRLINTADYKLENRSIGGQRIPVMVNQDGLEEVAYLVKGNSLATIALTGASTSEDLSHELDHMLSTWAWK